MMENSAQHVAAYLYEEIGVGLRSVGIVTGGDWQKVYLRDDLEDQFDMDSYEQLINMIITPDHQAENSDELPIGSRQASVHYHDSAFLCEFPVSESESILISVEKDVGQGLQSFLNSCISMIGEEE